MSDSPTTHETTVSPEEASAVAKQVSSYLKIGILSVVITCLTVFFSFLTNGNIIIAMALATVNALLIGTFTMHLNAEKPSVVRTVFVCLFFCADLLLVTLLAYSDRISL